MPSSITEFRVRRGDLRRTEIGHSFHALGEGQARFRIDRFALTSNNVTYAAFGEAMHYWDFFPAPDGWGIVPVWGFATVIESRVADLAEGARIYGYWPMASHAILTPGKFKRDTLGVQRFTDIAPHRAGLAAAYNGYGPADTGDEARYALFRPLYTTSFLIDDHLPEAAPEARLVILSSASSKTALGLAQALKARGGSEIVGLTSAANRDFVVSTGYFDRVLSYDDIETLPAMQRAAFVDFAGNAETRARIHRHFGNALVASLMIGATDWDAPRGDGADLPGARPVLFFAPAVLSQRIAEWGPAGFDARLTSAWEDFIDSTGWLTVIEEAGETAVARHYRDMVEGRVQPQQGLVLSL